ncbi:MAG: phosphate ABC transporter permease PstA [Eubacteriales bacterium]|nr:phosphate ABC transporter permease PstA [Eubacteriales bacterium]
MKARKVTDGLVKVFVWLCAGITAALLIWILVYIMSRGLPHVTWEYLTSKFGGDDHGIYPMIVSTLCLVGLTLLFAAPVGVFAAVYLVEYAKPGKLVNVIRFATECLSGIPSILFGLFGFIFFVQICNFKFSLLSGALTLALMVLPTIIRTTEEVLKTVPVSYKEGSLALGANKLYTLFRITLPSALPGVLTALILSIGRIVGETAAVFLTAGMVYRVPKSIFSSGRTLAVHLYAIANEGFSFDECFATAAVLVVLVLLINFAADLAGKLLIRRLGGGQPN